MCQQCHMILQSSSTTFHANLMHISKTYTLNFLNAKLLKTDKENLFPCALGILTTKKKCNASIE